MCSTCGCSQDAHARLTKFDDSASSPDSSHAIEHDSLHDHAHEPHHRHAEHLRHADSHSHPHEDHHQSHQITRTLRLEQDILAKNDRIAERNRAWFELHGIVACNLMSSPGAGKTTLLERTVRDLKNQLAIGVIEGDQETVRDAERIRSCGCPVVQINTGAGCHLDAEMLNKAIGELAPSPRSLLMIENVGNLVCPALFDLGERCRVVIMSVTEGEDKPLKYPHMFRASDLLLLSKIDLLPHVPFEIDRCRDYARRVNPKLKILEVSALQGDGISDWYSWIRERFDQFGVQ